jgi:DNA invertase Pin-like site-specific DNA recombinase
MANLIGVFAQFERDLIAERVKAGMALAKAKGKPIGRRPLIDTKLLWTINHMRNRGEKIRAIANHLNVSKSLVHKGLKILREKSLNFQGEEGEKTLSI